MGRGRRRLSPPRPRPAHQTSGNPETPPTAEADHRQSQERESEAAQIMRETQEQDRDRDHDLISGMGSNRAALVLRPAAALASLWPIVTQITMSKITGGFRL